MFYACEHSNFSFLSFLSSIKDTRVPRWGGGTPQNFIAMFKDPMMMTAGGASPFANEYHPDIDLRRKYAVFYRAIHGRPVEIMSVTRLPKTNKRMMAFFKSDIYPKERYYENILDYIPEYQDLTAINKGADIMTKYSAEERAVLRAKLSSYWAHMAIYNPDTREVEHITYAEYNCLLDDVGFDRSREQEIKAAVKNVMRLYHKT